MKTIGIESQMKSESDTKLTQKSYLNIIASFLDYGARLAVSFIVTPIVVSGLGSLLYGVWQMLFRLVSHIPAASGRPAKALTFVVAKSQASDDFTEKRRFVGSALGVWLIFFPLFMIAGVILVWLSPTITKVAPEMSSVVRIACAFLVINLLFVGLITIPDSVLKGMNLSYKRMGMVAGVNVVGGFLTVGVIYLGFGLIGVAGVQIIISILNGCLFLFVVRKYVPWFGAVLPSKTEVLSFLGLSSWYTGWTLVNKLLLASDVVVLGIVASAYAVTKYALTGYAAQVIAGFIFMAVWGITPGLGGVIGQKQYNKASEIRSELMIISWLLITASGATILLWNRSFIHLWVGAEHYAGFWVNLMIVVVVTQWVFFRIDGFVIDLTLDLKRKVILGAVSAILSICFSVILIPSLGIVGLCLGLVAGRLILTISYPLIVNKFFGKSYKDHLNSLLRPIVVIIILYVISGYLSQDLLVNNWIEWVFYTGLSFTLFLFTGFIAGFNKEQREQLIQRIKTINIFKLNVN
jgi:O-antigen/teichoic acid export membrane protein